MSYPVQAEGLVNIDVINRTLVGGVLPLCRNAVSVFNSPSRLEQNWIRNRQLKTSKLNAVQNKNICTVRNRNSQLNTRETDEFGLYQQSIMIFMPSFWKLWWILSHGYFLYIYETKQSDSEVSVILEHTRGVMVIIVGNGHGDTSSNPGRDWLHFTLH